MLLQLNAKNILQQLLSWRKDSSCSPPRQPKASLEDLDSPFSSFQGTKILWAALKILVVGGDHPVDCTGEQNYPSKPCYREQKPWCLRAAQIRAGRSAPGCSLQGEHIQRPSSPAAGATMEPRGALQGRGAWGLPSGHREPIAGVNCSTPGVKVCKNMSARGLDSQYPSCWRVSFIMMGHERMWGCHSSPAPAAPEEWALSANPPPHAPVANVTLKNGNGEDNWVGSGKKNI